MSQCADSWRGPVCAQSSIRLGDLERTVAELTGKLSAEQRLNARDEKELEQLRGQLLTAQVIKFNSSLDLGLISDTVWSHIIGVNHRLYCALIIAFVLYAICKFVSSRSMFKRPKRE